MVTHGRQGQTALLPSAGRGRATPETCMTPGRAPLATPPQTPGSGAGASAASAAGGPSASRPIRPCPGIVANQHGKPASWQGLAMDSKSELDAGGYGGGNAGGTGATDGRSIGMARGAADREGVVRFEPLLSKQLVSGRVAAFAGGAAGAFLVSQEFGVRSGQRGSMRHGMTKVLCGSVCAFLHNLNCWRERRRSL